jgi:hypothetical protein
MDVNERPVGAGLFGDVSVVLLWSCPQAVGTCPIRAAVDLA